MTYLLRVIIFAWLLIHDGTTAAAASDEYIAGYAAAVLEHEFDLPGSVIHVDQGIVTVYVSRLGADDPYKIAAALQRIPGVLRADVRKGPDPGRESAQAVRAATPEPESKFLPRGLLVDPFHADLRWPHFGAGYRQLSSGQQFANSFGESFAFYRNAAPFHGQWELGMQAGVFSIFDIDRNSIDLINADYNVGLLASYRADKWSGFIRIHHQSSHLGDEFILNNPQVNRINLSFEEIDLKVSYDLTTWLRIYGGVGTIIRKEPTDLGKHTSQAGIEFKSPWFFWNGKVRPVAYADFQANARTNWRVGQSIMGGLQFENARIGDRKLQVLAEYFSGPSPNGQLYSQRVEWIGMGVHLWF
ncbi:MAG: uncharacterized protein K0S45_4249 [Nitrospira sp.]|jgi:hypothetical protein|nr:uncharacterized protein [Nitrospira sp.]